MLLFETIQNISPQPVLKMRFLVYFRLAPVSYKSYHLFPLKSINLVGLVVEWFLIAMYHFIIIYIVFSFCCFSCLFLLIIMYLINSSHKYPSLYIWEYLKFRFQRSASLFWAISVKVKICEQIDKDKWEYNICHEEYLWKLACGNK